MEESVREKGVWFYYARGCSDLFYDVGRTLSARNKVDAALKLAQLSGQLQPAAHVAEYLRRGPLHVGSTHLKPRYARVLNESANALEAVLVASAPGPFFHDANGAPHVSAAFCNATFMRLAQGHILNSLSENRRAACVGQCALAEVGAMLLLFEFLDDYLAREARRLRFDSLQLLQVRSCVGCPAELSISLSLSLLHTPPINAECYSLSLACMQPTLPWLILYCYCAGAAERLQILCQPS